MKILITTIVIFSILFLVVAPDILLAACQGTDCVTAGLEVTTEKAGLDTGANATNLPRIIGRAINALFGIIGVIFLTVVLIGGYEWMTSGGSEEKIAKGKKFIINGINGMIVIFLAYALVYVIMFSLSRATGS
ncbi:MAG: hypothetical protein HUU49_04835 [Candidatus Buchananbacteria bacterium]|nr:hypothetical protein [Candidatus Buchananbacteria bacterium]